MLLFRKRLITNVDRSKFGPIIAEVLFLDMEPNEDGEYKR